MTAKQVVEKHQVAGIDDRERGFSRLMEIEAVGDRYRAVFRYETMIVTTQSRETAMAALHDLISLLQDRGYTQLRSRLNFRGDLYLGSQEPWLEYPDPGGPPGERSPVTEQLARRSGWIAKVLGLFK